MLVAARHGSFSVLIVSEQKSIGREAYETNYHIKVLSRLGVEVIKFIPEGGVPSWITDAETFDADYGRLLELAANRMCYLSHR